MSEEKKDKDIFSLLEEEIAIADASGDVSKSKALQLRLDYLKSLDDPEDVKRLMKKSTELRSDINYYTNGGANDEEFKKVLNAGMPERTERDAKSAKKTINEEWIKSNIVPKDSSLDEFFDFNSDYSWYKWTNAQGKEYAKAAGMPYGDFLKKIAEMDAKNQRKHIANDGILAKATSILLPRVQKDIERDGNVSAASVAIDLAENAAQAVPVGRVAGSLPKIGKLYKAANGTKATLGKAVAENAIVPTTFAYADAARKGDVSEGAYGSLLGTSVNMATPARATMGLSRLGRMGVSGLAKTYKGSTDKILNNYVTNKIGKNKYGQEAIAQITSLDPTGVMQNVADNLPGSPLNEENKRKDKQKELDAKHVDYLVENYKTKFGVR